MHIIIFAICGFFGARYYGLNGFIISTIISRFQLWLSFVLILYSITKKTDMVNEEE